MTPEEFASALEKQGLPISEQKIGLFREYLTFMLAYNEKVNLTAITEPGDIWLKHFYDSLTPLIFLPVPNPTIKFSLIDVGSGAGFPGIPLKIADPNLQLTLLDSLQKRIVFLDKLVRKLSLDDVETVHGRAEDFGQNPNFREKYDFAIARAVSGTNTLLELLLPFVKVGGKAILMKTVHDENEIFHASKALEELGGRASQSFSFELPNGDPRVLIVVDKIEPTKNKYPRKAGTPKRSPIGGKNG
ncbi:MULTISPECIES: 16S rRNA (guanine(527)-N(7))-methyltransferase RsmG [Oenococcus]|uniref:Ribosomal RNA small subunit methyltransferase G n=1 Tax=Oenococcus kitaharae DSM 17330 TaxID=1045004 RepID=G9WJ55_9LACO|nr:16S rRNA (guanine(527)-N(7))-methyltransferase RsmG [Oenococcus kitaharae]EHN58504.1 rRNA small subunit methyltransfer glucose inhibited division protein [Oenococcus kitaharae DSM 17330]OEY81344.1 16S rRNA methyltransferase [Oenococcus kitaharae]OEY82832.1 16S rRNA methyltransferase [Oenococcus kitaharae]OEY84624.1 16S rRNA methyltransferase [Oenococcus kitaharae]